MNANITRRSLIQASMTAAMSMSIARNLAAQEATPADHEHTLNPSRPMPETTVHITDADLVFPATVPAGINLVTFENRSAGEAHVLTMRLPDDVNMDELFATLSDPEAPMPEYLRDQYYPGIPDFPPLGGSLSAYIRYEPGAYIAINITGTQTPAFFDVVGDPWGVSPPMAQHQVGMVEMTFLGLDEPVPQGAQMWSLVNFGATWHEIMLIGMPELITPEELLEFFMSTESAEDLEAAGYFQVCGSGIMSPGVEQWIELELQPGAYAALCFAPDDFAGPPHALSGMISIFEVV